MFNIILFFLCISSTLQAQNHSLGTWKDYVLGRPNLQYFEAKKAVAQSWGIDYETVFAGCEPSKETDSLSLKYQKENQPCFNTLIEKFGADWGTYLEQDIRIKMSEAVAEPHPTISKKLKKNKQKNIWFHYYGALALLDSCDLIHAEIAKKWGLNYTLKVRGCLPNQKMQQQYYKDQQITTTYFAAIAKELGEDWKFRFNLDVQKECVCIQKRLEEQ